MLVHDVSRKGRNYALANFLIEKGAATLEEIKDEFPGFNNVNFVLHNYLCFSYDKENRKWSYIGQRAYEVDDFSISASLTEE